MPQMPQTLSELSGIEVTPLSPQQEVQFRAWAAKNNISDVDAPESFYDYRGYWKDVASKGESQTKLYPDGIHFPDTYKQHGHPTFSIESKYSRGPMDGGRWQGETFIPPVQLATSRKNVNNDALYAALQRLLSGQE